VDCCPVCCAIAAADSLYWDPGWDPVVDIPSVKSTESVKVIILKFLKQSAVLVSVSIAIKSNFVSNKKLKL